MTREVLTNLNPAHARTPSVGLNCHCITAAIIGVFGPRTNAVPLEVISR